MGLLAVHILVLRNSVLSPKLISIYECNVGERERNEIMLEVGKQMS